MCIDETKEVRVKWSLQVLGQILNKRSIHFTGSNGQENRISANFMMMFQLKEKDRGTTDENECRETIDKEENRKKRKIRKKRNKEQQTKVNSLKIRKKNTWKEIMESKLELLKRHIK